MPRPIEGVTLKDLCSPVRSTKNVEQLNEELKGMPECEDEIKYNNLFVGDDVYDVESGELFDYIKNNSELTEAFGTAKLPNGKVFNQFEVRKMNGSGYTVGLVEEPFGGYWGVTGKYSELEEIAKNVEL